MSQPSHQPRRKLRSHGVRASEIYNLLNILRALDRNVVEVSMHLYKIPRRDRAAMREQHRHLHDTIRQHLPRSLYRAKLCALCSPVDFG